MRIVLAIETSNPSAWREGLPRPGVAVGVMNAGGTEVVSIADLDTTNPQHDDLMTCIDRAVAAAKASPLDIARIAVSVGPGGFTNVRIAVTTARMVAEVTGASCVPVPSAVVVARRVHGASPFAVALASKNDTAHITLFQDAWESDGAGVIMSAADLPALAARGVRMLIGDQYMPKTIVEAAQRAGLSIQHPVFDPAACLEAGLDLPAVDPVALAPLYPREPEAVTKWRAARQDKPA